MERRRALLERRPPVTRTSRRLRARRVALCAAVLPALLLRALIPVGFMPVTGAGGASIGLCPGAAALPPVTAPRGDAHGAAPGHAHHHSGTPAGGGAPHHAPCLFAAGATLASASAMVASPASAPVTTAGDRPPDTPVFFPTVLRAQSPRAPPVNA